MSKVRLALLGLLAVWVTWALTDPSARRVRKVSKAGKVTWEPLVRLAPLDPQVRKAARDRWDRPVRLVPPEWQAQQEFPVLPDHLAARVNRDHKGVPDHLARWDRPDSPAPPDSPNRT